MQTEKLKLYIHKRVEPSQYSFEKDIEINICDISVMEHRRGEFVMIGTHEVEVPIPDIDVTAQAIEGLEKQASEVMERARAHVQQIQERIQSLRCIEHAEAES